MASRPPKELREVPATGPQLTQNVQMEAKLLSLVLYDPSLLPEVRHIFRFPKGTRARPFYRELHQQLYNQMCAHYDNGEIPEYETLYDSWVGDDLVRRSDERELLNSLLNMALSSDTALTNRLQYVKQWATRLHKHALRRGVYDIATSAAGIAMTPEEQSADSDPINDMRKVYDTFGQLLLAGAQQERFRLKSISEIRQRERSAWILPGMLQERKLWLIYGDSNTGKSFLALDWGLCWATGTPWQGREMQQGHVVYVCAEGIDGLRDRIDAWLSHHNMTDAPMFHVIDDSPNLLESGDVLEVIAQIQMLGTAPIVVIFDTLADSMPGGKENDGEDYGIVIRAMRRVQRECGCAVLTVHHTGKDTAKGPRGHAKLRAAMDTAVEVSRDEQTDDLVIRCNKQRESQYFAPFNLKLQSIALDDYGDVTSCVLDASTNAPPPPAKPKTKQLSASCVDVLKVLESCAAGIRAKDLLAALVDTKRMSKQTMYNALNELLANHRVEKGDGEVWRLV